MHLDPPPSIVKLVSSEYDIDSETTKDNIQPDSIWKKWLLSLYEWQTSVAATIPPKMTTVERDALVAENGMIIYNITTDAFNFYEAGIWVTK